MKYPPHLLELSASCYRHEVAVLKAAALRDRRKCAGKEEPPKLALPLDTHLERFE